jgi:hypothetical protein
MTTFMRPFKKAALKRGLAERYQIAGMTLDAAGEFQFQEQGGDGRG